MWKSFSATTPPNFFVTWSKTTWAIAISLTFDL